VNKHFITEILSCKTDAMGVTDEPPNYTLSVQLYDINSGQGKREGLVEGGGKP